MSDLSFEMTAEMPPDLIPLLASILWGTRGALYRLKECQATLEAPPSRWYLLIRKAGKLVAARSAIKKSFVLNNQVTPAFYHSLFSVHLSEQGKGYGKLLARYTLDKLAPLLEQRGFIYSYIEEGNVRSAAIAASLGYQQIGHFHVHPISRLFPRVSARVGGPGEGERRVFARLLEERYTGHVLTDFESSLNPSKYWALYERGSPVAGVQVLPQCWQIERLPGLGGVLALKCVPHLPVVRELISPGAFHFLKIGNIYFERRRAEAFFELLEDLLRRHEMKAAALYIDHRSPMYEELRASQSFGILNPLMQTRVNVWGFLQSLSRDQVSELQNRPFAISAVDA